jgi:hypothetical protein
MEPELARAVSILPVWATSTDVSNHPPKQPRFALVPTPEPTVRAFERIAALIIVLVAANASTAFGQAAAKDTSRGSTPSVTHILKTVQGSVLLGRLLQDAPGSDSVRFETDGGVMLLARTQIASLVTVAPQDFHDGQYWFRNPNATRLFFAPTGRTLRRGEGYYSNTLLVFNGATVGVTDRVTIGGNVSLIPSSGSQLAYVTPKAGVYSSEDLNVSVGALLAYNGFGETDSERQFGILYSVATMGSPDASVTGGIGWGYQGSGLARRPVVMLGGVSRVSRRTALLTENYVVSTSSETTGIFSYGIRFFNETISVDLAFINSTAGSVFPGIPFVSFAVKF